MRHSTTSYALETPDSIWNLFKNGPGAAHDRLNDRVVALIALDTLHHDDPGDMPAPARDTAVEIVEDTPGLSVPEQYSPLPESD